jgi:hypothetical protein
LSSNECVGMHNERAARVFLRLLQKYDKCFYNLPTSGPLSRTIDSSVVWWPSTEEVWLPFAVRDVFVASCTSLKDCQNKLVVRDAIDGHDDVIYDVLL